MLASYVPCRCSLTQIHSQHAYRDLGGRWWECELELKVCATLRVSNTSFCSFATEVVLKEFGECELRVCYLTRGFERELEGESARLLATT